jgi:PAS domain S-box-containing protein
MGVLEGALPAALISIAQFFEHAVLEIATILLIGAVATCLILRERRRCRREVRQAHEHYRSILDNAPDAIVLFGDDFCVAEWNTAAECLYGIRREDAVGRKAVTVPLERWNELRELLGRIERNQPVLDYESERLRANGRRIPVALSYARMPAGKDRPILYLEIAHDITERLKMRDKLLEMEKLTLMGRIAAGTAHHMNTPLTAMLLETEMLAVRLKGREEAGDLSLIKDRIRYCQAFVRELLCFARVPAVHPKAVGLCETVEAAANLLRPSLAIKNASLHIDVKELEGARILGDPNHFEAAFSALLSNAMDAIPARGAIHIRGRVETGAAQISIEDNGPGIRPDLLASVFEPFFTTKPSGCGTGLGLPTARNIVERHGGTLQLQPGLGGGTRAIVRLPLLPVSASHRVEETAA